MKYEILKYERIRNLRIDNNLTQREIADILGVKQNTYSQYEIGKISYPIDALPILAKFYKVSVDYLLGLTDKTKPYN
ncbi:MAG: helix-turn-helix domain-containing protein [Oscillospiraceae bacterium]|nr:helix-turn-helix domain-containing protein [Oscillospiraceae bacterium]